MSSVLIYILIGVVGVWLTYHVVFFTWRLRSSILKTLSRPRHLTAQKAVLWRDPGAVETLDLAGGPGGRKSAPYPPFRFLKENASGSSAGLTVKDANGRHWRVKWGDEVNSEVFATRLVWACGYFVEPCHFVAEGTIKKIPHESLGRARDYLDEKGRFQNARFELDDRSVRKLFDEHGWAWNENPFVGTRELNGLKILMMLLSNWDNKDVRDIARGSNTAIFEYKNKDGSREARYLIIDWGATMGKWGNPVVRGKWDCQSFLSQNPQFVLGRNNDYLRWGYGGQRTSDIAEGIRVEDARWLYGYLNRISNDQLRAALRASGASEEETACFTQALRERIQRLGEVSSP